MRRVAALCGWRVRACRRTWTARLGAPDGPLLCEGTIRIGWVDAARMQSARLPAGLLQALQSGHADDSAA